jgi:hypothetical protein
MASLATTVCVNVKVEPRYKRANAHNEQAQILQPDATFLFPRTTLWTDVSVTFPCAQNYVAQASRTQRSAASTRESNKRGKYEDEAKRQNASFLPLVFETFGAHGKKMSEFVRLLSNEAIYCGKGPADKFAKYARNFLSITLVKANDIFIREALRASSAS